MASRTSPASTHSPPKESSLVQAIRRQIAAAPRGYVFTPADFTRLGSRAAIDQTLSRLAGSGELRRVARGLYDRPRRHALVGELAPSADAIARALAGKSSLRLQPSGAYAANLLGLSEQVPMRVVFLTDGASRNVRVGRQTIVLKHTTPRNMATAGRVSGLVIQALRHLKKSGADAEVVRRLRRRLTGPEKKVLAADAALAPAWISRIMLAVAHDQPWP